MNRALRAFQDYVRQLISKIRAHIRGSGGLFGLSRQTYQNWGYDSLAYQYRLQTPLSAITRAPMNRQRYFGDAFHTTDESSSSRRNRYRPY
jgi:hypothetical protein